MAARKRRTAEYDEAARLRLGEAVERTRRWAGYRWRTDFVVDTRISKRSLQAVERGEPTVGVSVLEEIGRALGRRHPEWNEGTPWAILDGGPVPALVSAVPSARAAARAVEHAALEIIQDPDKVGTDEWLEAAADLFEGDDLVAVLRIGLEARKRRREIQEALALVLRQTAERVQLDGVSDDRSRVD